MPLNMTRIAFGAESHGHLRQRLEAHASIGEVRLTTRYLPKRHEEMVGGSLYWILNHSLIGRSPLIGFMDNGEGRTWIRLRPELIAVRTIPKRAHQGWRYLETKDAPPDLGAVDADGLDEMPAQMLGELMKIGLV
ncbi:MAG: DUF1489 domain-containing protein [Sphingobium sp.]|nr:MAG: DUF1489 domain-containing protein [Sphingobium sp.]